MIFKKKTLIILLVFLTFLLVPAIAYEVSGENVPYGQYGDIGPNNSPPIQSKNYDGNNETIIQKKHSKTNIGI